MLGTTFNKEAHNESEFVGHEPCNQCGSKDNAAIYTDGHTYCFGCRHYEPADGQKAVEPAKTEKRSNALIDGYYTALKVRGITEETCRKYDYQVTDNYMDRPQQIANYRNSEGLVVAQKIRDADKNFSILGEAKKMVLFGQHLWSGGKKLVVTEGEIDCMSVSQVQGNKFATVSLGQGATSGKKSLLAAWDYLNLFDEIILMYDQDEAGQKAALECAESLPIGKVKIAKLPYKDANECLQKGEGKSIIDAIWQAKVWRPDGIITTQEVYERMKKGTKKKKTADYPFTKLNDMTCGIRDGLVTICAGTGAGKSTFIKEIAFDLHKQGHKVGMVMLEEDEDITLCSLLSIHLNKNIVIDEDAITAEQFDKAMVEVFPDDHNINLYELKGVNTIDAVINNIQYMVKGFGCEYIFLDPISVLVAGATGQVADERRLIDSIILTLSSLVRELGICLFLVSHLTRPQGKGHEDGGQVRISELRGSSSIAMLSDFCIGLQKLEDDPHADIREIVLLKNRFTGETGMADTLQYHRDEGRLIEAASKF
jgi:twinkle protein